MRRGNHYRGDRALRTWNEASPAAALPDLHGEADVSAFGAEELATLDEPTAKLITEALMIAERLERSDVKREGQRELDEFADRIADSVAERLADHGL
jgi:hypothetical protein